MVPNDGSRVEISMKGGGTHTKYHNNRTLFKNPKMKGKKSPSSIVLVQPIVFYTSSIKQVLPKRHNKGNTKVHG